MDERRPGDETPELEPTVKSDIPAETPSEAPTQAQADSEPATASIPFEAERNFPGFEILETLGAGGMGVVYLAQQAEPRRKVALKVMRPDLATPAMMSRFQHEVQLLGRLQHPGIAQIYQAGTTETAEGEQPYFVMEYVRGEPLLDYVERQKLDTRERLKLLARICDPVHHAHQKGIVHRDLKPANILVTEDGQPSILDFGVARMTESDLALTTMHTEAGELIGTVVYMSPEQAQGDPTRVDTRSDVYALGVIAYQLLSGRFPYDFGGKMLLEVLRVITEDEPTAIGSIDRSLGGDLETILLKALEKEPERRYQSASDLGADLRRFLADEPIAARPPSAAYQLRKFAKRNRVLVGSIAAIFVALTAATVVSLSFAVQAREEREVARAEARKSEAVLEFLTTTLSAVDPQVAQTRDVTMREVLDQTARGVGPSLSGQPDVENAVRVALGTTYRGLGLYDQSEEQLRTVLESATQRLGPDHQDVAAVHFELGETLFGGEKWDQADDAYRLSLEIRRRSLGETHADTLESQSMLAVSPAMRGENERSIELLDEVIELQLLHVGLDNKGTLNSINNRGVVLRRLGRYPEARVDFEKAFEARRRFLGDRHPKTAESLRNLGQIEFLSGEFEAAEGFMRTALEISTEVLGPEHGHTLQAQMDLAMVLRRLDRLDEAIALSLEGFDAMKRVLGEDNPTTVNAGHTLGDLLMSANRDAEAAEILAQAVAAASGIYPASHYITSYFSSTYGQALSKLGRYEEAESLLLAAIEPLRSALGTEHRLTQATIKRLEDLYDRWQRPEERAKWSAQLIVKDGSS